MQKEHDLDTFFILIICTFHQIFAQMVKSFPQTFFFRWIITKIILFFFVKNILRIHQNTIHIEKIPFYFFHDTQNFYFFSTHRMLFIERFHGHFSTHIIIITAFVIHSPSMHFQQSFHLIFFQHFILIVLCIRD